MVVAVGGGKPRHDHARPWIEQAKSSYWQLMIGGTGWKTLQSRQRAEAVWIDENGKIVRPPEDGGLDDHFAAWISRPQPVA